MTEVARAITSALRDHRGVSDRTFDSLFPRSERVRSRYHWTPVEIAKRVSTLLARDSVDRVLDVGSGVGKLCLVGALTSRVEWVGIDRNHRRVEIARQAARLLGIEARVRFELGDATATDWSQFDAIYLFNPFADQLTDRALDVMSRRESYVALVERAQQRLIETRPGTRLVTYHGIGGDIPSSFELDHCEAAGNDQLCVWIHKQ